jgi:hypothetical protein
MVRTTVAVSVENCQTGPYSCPIHREPPPTASETESDGESRVCVTSLVFASTRTVAPSTNAAQTAPVEDESAAGVKCLLSTTVVRPFEGMSRSRLPPAVPLPTQTQPFAVATE